MRDFIYIGYVAKTHGLFGSFSIKLDGDKKFCQACQKITRFFVEKKQIINIKKSDLNSNIFLRTHTLEITTKEAAKYLLRKSIYIKSGDVQEIDDIIKKTTELIGFRVLNKKEEIGIVDSIDYNRKQPVMKIKNRKEEILAPYVKEFIIKTNKKERQLIVDFPDGLIDICKS